MYYNKAQSGYSLVEVLVSIAVLLIAIVGPMTIASQGIKTAAYSLEQNTAFFLAQEGIEAMFKLRGDFDLRDVAGAGPDSWDWIADELNGRGPCSLGSSCDFGVYFSAGTVQFTSNTCDAGNESNCLLYKSVSTPDVFVHTAGGDATLYTRIITVEVVDAFTVNIRSRVTWESRVFRGQQQSLMLESTLFDQRP